jgi:signal transduction histidine kinase
VSFDSDSYIEKVIRFDIEPHFYQTWLFKGLLALVIILVLLSVFWFRLYQLTYQKDVLEKTVKERTLELNRNIKSLESTTHKLEASQDELKQSNELLQKAIGVVLHDLRSPLRFLSSISKDVSHNWKNMSQEDIDKMLNLFYSNTTNIYYFTNNLLEWLMANSKEQAIRKEYTNVKVIILDIIELYRDLVVDNRNMLYVDIAEEDLEVITSSNLLAIIIRNLIDNANKYTRKGSISVKAFKDGNDVKVVVEDTGKGFDVEGFFKGLEEGGNGKSNTLGLKMIYDLTQKLKITYTIVSEPGKGTKAELLLPYNADIS